MTYTASTFNLIDEPWIITQGFDGIDRTLSLSDVIINAGELRFIGGDIPTQTFAITRVLLAVARRAIAWGDNPVERWVQIWRSGVFPVDEVTSYLMRVRPRFDLLSGYEPFYQVADLATANGEFKPVDRLLADVPTGEKYFTTRAGSGTESLSYSEAARWVVHCQCYDISGIKSADARDPRGRNGKGYPIGTAWAGQMGGVIFEGGTVFETLMLNTVLKGPDGRAPRVDDLPVWERNHPDYRQRESLTPSGPCDLLTWQSRRIRLVADDRRIVKVLVANGDPLESHNRWNSEFMSGWRYSEAQSKKFGEDRYLPLQWDAGRALWRGIEGLLADIPETGMDRFRVKASGTAHWLSSLLDEERLDPDSFIRPHVYGLTYINQSSVVGAGIDDALQMRVALLSRSSAARFMAAATVNSAAEAVRALGTLASRLAQAAGGLGDGERQAAEAAAFFALDGHYRHWLKDLREDCDGAVDQEAVWQETVRRVVQTAGSGLLEEAGEPAWKGREVKGQWLDTAVAEAMFRGALRKALPYAYREQSTIESSSQ